MAHLHGASFFCACSCCEVCTAFCEMGYDIVGNATVLLCDDAPASSASWNTGETAVPSPALRCTLLTTQRPAIRAMMIGSYWIPASTLVIHSTGDEIGANSTDESGGSSIGMNVAGGSGCSSAFRKLGIKAKVPGSHSFVCKGSQQS